ncbi:MAG TPA: PHP domain-containing protein [Gemmatimonadales bacterium]|nr:PHP domain-containing protein [Gemmatimonadales bacterium]
MVSLDHALAALASIAAIRGRQAEATDLARLAARMAQGQPLEGGGPDSASVRDALEHLRAGRPEQAVADALQDLPQDLRRLVRTSGLDVSEVAALHRETGATSIGELEACLADAQGWPGVPGLDARLRQAIPLVRSQRRHTPLGRAWALVEPVVTAVRETCPEVEHVSPTGSMRRFAATVGDIELLAASPDPAGTTARLLALPFVTTVLHASPGRVVLRLERTELTIRVVPPGAFPATLVLLTGSRAHVARLRVRAASLGLRLDRRGLWRDGGALDLVAENDVYAALELPAIAPELRESGEEVDAAERGALPDLVRVEDIRGDLHMHSTWSDGRDSIAAMVSAAEALGYEYVAITDHSKASAVARGLDEARLRQQAAEVADLRERHPGITILHGAEVDILEDGSLDFPDAVLEGLDVVLASLHDPAGHDGARLTDRYIAAMRHPLVQIVTHPTNRMLPGRDGYDLDEERLFAAAVETGTILEIDGAPGHLDMDGAMARRAVAAGVTVSIDGDCHRAEWLGRQMQLGVATARRGWVEARHVVNALPLDSLRARLGRKRRA